MIDFHLTVFLKHQNPGLATKIIFLSCLVSKLRQFNICSSIMLIHANYDNKNAQQIELGSFLHLGTHITNFCHKTLEYSPLLGSLWGCTGWQADYIHVMRLQHFARPLQWRHNDHGGVSNHQPHDCLLNRVFRRRSKKTSKLRVTGLCAGNSPGPVNSPHKGPVTRKMFPFDDFIMITITKTRQVLVVTTAQQCTDVTLSRETPN